MVKAKHAFQSASTHFEGVHFKNIHIDNVSKNPLFLSSLFDLCTHLVKFREGLATEAKKINQFEKSIVTKRKDSFGSFTNKHSSVNSVLEIYSIQDGLIIN